jgi:DNA modification methylase
MSHAPGAIRDVVVTYLAALGAAASVADIQAAVRGRLGDVPASSVRSYLNLNTPDMFERVGRGRYRLRGTPPEPVIRPFAPVLRHGQAALYHADCFAWLAQQPPASIHAVVTDPPYGLLEYSVEEQRKLRAGRGGVWRIPPAFDGHQRAPLPRFTVLDRDDRATLHAFFYRLGTLLARVTRPGANILIASNPLLAHIVATAMAEAGLEVRGTVVRLVMTLRGGDRPKNAHQEFSGVSVIPRAMFEPWVMLRRPLDGRAQDTLRRWQTGGFRRLSASQPFGDVIRSRPTSKAERALAPHPSLKPQDFLRHLVRAVLPLGEGTILDPFAGSGSTLAAANAMGHTSIGIEADARYVKLARHAIPLLSEVAVDPVGAELADAGAVQRRGARAKLATRITTKI